MFDFALAVLAARNDRDRLLVVQSGTKAVGIIAPVSNDPLHAHRVGDGQIGPLHVRGIAGRQDEADRSADNVDERMDLGGPATTRDANGIGSRPPFSPACTAMGFDIAAVDLGGFRNPALFGQSRENACPYAAATPAVPAIVDCCRGAILGRTISPASAALKRGDTPPCLGIRA